MLNQGEQGKPGKVREKKKNLKKLGKSQGNFLSWCMFQPDFNILSDCCPCDVLFLCQTLAHNLLKDENFIASFHWNVGRNK